MVSAPRKGGIIIDVGCGLGSNLTVFDEVGVDVIGLDRSYDKLKLVKQKVKSYLINGDLLELPIRNQSISVIIAMDVLEHLEDDVGGIQEMHRCLRPGGTLILTAPAFNFLWGIQDVVTNHKRRYSKREILRKLAEGNFEVVRFSYFNFFLFLPILVARRAFRLLKFPIRSENEINTPWLNHLLKAIFSIEPFFLRHFSFPFGVSMFCIAQKAEGTTRLQKIVR